MMAPHQLLLMGRGGGGEFTQRSGNPASVYAAARFLHGFNRGAVAPIG
jgi:hypothetical protein